MIQVGDLVRIDKSNSQKLVGKLAIVTKVYPWSAKIHIIHTGKVEKYANSKLTILEGK